MFCLRQKVRISFNPVSKTQEVIAQIPALMIPLQYHLKSALFYARRRSLVFPTSCPAQYVSSCRRD